MSELDPIIRQPTLCAALQRGEQSIHLAIRRGKIPLYSKSPNKRRTAMRAWRLSTIRAWRPDIAARCEAILAALETIPKAAA